MIIIFLRVLQFQGFRGVCWAVKTRPDFIGPIRHVSATESEAVYDG